jgi:hypothetical protein
VTWAEDVPHAFTTLEATSRQAALPIDCLLSLIGSMSETILAPAPPNYADFNSTDSSPAVGSNDRVGIIRSSA